MMIHDSPRSILLNMGVSISNAAAKLALQELLLVSEFSYLVSE